MKGEGEILVMKQAKIRTRVDSQRGNQSTGERQGEWSEDGRRSKGHRIQENKRDMEEAGSQNTQEVKTGVDRR